MREVLRSPKQRAFALPSLNRTGIWLMIALISLLELYYVAYIQRVKGLETSLFDWSLSFHLDPYDFGLMLQELLIPVALLSLLSSLPFFRRVVNGLARARSRWLLFAALLLIQGLFFVYLYELNRLEIWPINSFVLVLVAGLIGGWPMGLGIGVVTFVLAGTRGLLLWPSETVYWRDAFYWYYLMNGETAQVLWQGVVIGLLAKLLGRSRYMPIVAMTLGFVVEFVGRYLVVAAQDDVSNWTADILSVSLMSALVLAVLALMVRNVQANYVRQRSEAADLALTQAELRALRAQINPHFLFNSLNTIRYFVRTQPDKARDLLLDLSEVFQRALRSGDFVPLKDEISYVEAYLALEQARLGERLKIHWTLPDERILETAVPTLILQPLVENAVIHGISPKPEGGTISIVVEPWDNELVMQVRDDGLGFNTAQTMAGSSEVGRERAAIGLRNIQHRLKILYGETHRLMIESEVGRGTRVQLKLPLGKSMASQVALTVTEPQSVKALENA